MNYPEDIVNNMTLAELQNCDWDALFSQIQQTQYNINQNNGYTIDSKDQVIEHSPVLHQNNNTVYETKNLMMNQCKNGLQNDKQDIVIARKPIFIPLGKESLNACRAIEFRSALFLQSKFTFNNEPKLSSDEKGDMFDCKICDETFQTRSSLLTHVKVHQQPFCALCLSPFKSISGYRIHNSKLHNIPWIKEKQNKEEVEEDSNDSNETEEKDDSDSRSSFEETKRNNLYDIYDNLNTVTLTSKYGRRRKVLDMTAVITKKSRKSK